MNFTVCDIELPSDRHTLGELLVLHFNAKRESDRLVWSYLQSPDGKAKGWFLLDRNSDKAVGAAAAFCRRFCVGHRVSQTWVLGDFCLEPGYRSLGPALQLQRACLSVLESGDAAFCYDFPSAGMLAVYQRLRMGVTGQMMRLALPLRVDRQLNKLVASRAVRGALSAAGNALLKWNLPRIEGDRSLKLSILEGRCGDEFTALAEENRGEYGICLERSAAYLNWRYVDNPLARHEIVSAQRDGHLVGYIVWTQTAEDGAIVDLFGQKDRNMMRRLIAQIISLARERGVQTLSVSMNEGHPWLSLFSEMGFRRRESFPVVVIPSKSFKEEIDSKLTGWYLMHGDRDS